MYDIICISICDIIYDIICMSICDIMYYITRENWQSGLTILFLNLNHSTGSWYSITVPVLVFSHSTGSWYSITVPVVGIQSQYR